MKMETTVVAPNEGAINKVQLKGGTLVNTINLILVLYCWLLFEFKSIFGSTYQNTHCNCLTCPWLRQNHDVLVVSYNLETRNLGLSNCFSQHLVNQSPIDITTSVGIDAILPPLKLNYAALNTTDIINNGHTAQLNIEPGASLAVDDKILELE